MKIEIKIRHFNNPKYTPYQTEVVEMLAVPRHGERIWFDGVPMKVCGVTHHISENKISVVTMIDNLLI